MHTAVLLNTFWELTRGVERDKDSFIQKALKVCKTFKVNCLKTPKLDVPAKKTAYNPFYKDIQETKVELKGIAFSKASATISKEWKKTKASDKKMKKYRGTETFMKWRNSLVRKLYRHTKKIIWTKWR